MSEKKLTKKQAKALKFKKSKKGDFTKKEFEIDELGDITYNPDHQTEPITQKETQPKDNNKKNNQRIETKLVEEEEEGHQLKEGGEKAEQEGENIEGNKLKKGPKNRFIVFVGNLPRTLTSEELKKHFETCEHITSVRLMTDKVTQKPKGFAFLEFENSRSLSKALHFHHSIFKGRQINVEVTVGGGGKSNNRKDKLKEKNKKLNEEREAYLKKQEAMQDGGIKLAFPKPKRNFSNPENNQDPLENKGSINPERLNRFKKPKN